MFLGAVIVRNCSSHVLMKTYFGGGTVDVSLATCNYHVSRQQLSDRLLTSAVSHFCFAGLVCVYIDVYFAKVEAHKQYTKTIKKVIQYKREGQNTKIKK